MFEVVFKLAHPRMVALAGQKPPEHFHPYQDEYVEVTRGRLVVEIEGREHILTPASGEFVIPRWANHRLYPPPPPSPAAAGTATSSGDGGNEDGKETRFLLSGEDTPRLFRLDAVFFENWYAYQDEVLLHGKSIDVLQVMCVSTRLLGPFSFSTPVLYTRVRISHDMVHCLRWIQMFDAGGSYLSLPWWVPFRRTVALVLGVALGRCVGALLGYQPFHREWTTDWDAAVEKMGQSVFQRRFADHAKTD